tara:strand:- start:9 stop:212 length:204 start_codon:yes stop_codon:yes gene_type:complete
MSILDEFASVVNMFSSVSLMSKIPSPTDFKVSTREDDERSIFLAVESIFLAVDVDLPTTTGDFFFFF